jgi:hypothetical protein
MQGSYRNRGSSENYKSMTHKDMFLRHILNPIAESLHGFFDYFAFKAIVIAGSLPAILSLELFQTPADWWKGLVYLVILDWLFGVISAIHRGEFDFRVMTKKWYQVTGYSIVCGGAAIMSNTFGLFYYFQFIVYACFFLKEFISILETFRILPVFLVAWQAFITKELNIHRFNEFKDEVKKRGKKDHDTSHDRDIHNSI